MLSKLSKLQKQILLIAAETPAPTPASWGISGFIPCEELEKCSAFSDNRKGDRLYDKAEKAIRATGIVPTDFEELIYPKMVAPDYLGGECFLTPFFFVDEEYPSEWDAQQVADRLNAQLPGYDFFIKEYPTPNEEWRCRVQDVVVRLFGADTPSARASVTRAIKRLVVRGLLMRNSHQAKELYEGACIGLTDAGEHAVAALRFASHDLA